MACARRYPHAPRAISPPKSPARRQSGPASAASGDESVAIRHPADGQAVDVAHGKQKSGRGARAPYAHHSAVKEGGGEDRAAEPGEALRMHQERAVRPKQVVELVRQRGDGSKKCDQELVVCPVRRETALDESMHPARIAGSDGEERQIRGADLLGSGKLQAAVSMEVVIEMQADEKGR